MKTNLDPFTAKRLEKWIGEFRAQSGHPPALKDLEAAGFDRKQIDVAVKGGVLEQFYTTLTNGTIVKTYKVSLEKN